MWLRGGGLEPVGSIFGATAGALRALEFFRVLEVLIIEVTAARLDSQFIRRNISQEST